MEPFFKNATRAVVLATAIVAVTATAQAQDRPNILVIWGDDIGRSNISAYTMGMMGYRTPNIDRVAREGMIFTDYYGEQSCTAGRSSFIMGQSVFRTGLSKVGLPNTYYDWLLDRVYMFVPAQAYLAQFLETFTEYPPRQRAASFSLDQVLEKLASPGAH